MDERIKQFRVVIERDEDSMFVAYAPALPGCHTQARTYEEVIGRMKEAIKLYLEVLKEKRQLEKILHEPSSRFFAIEDIPVQV